MMIPFHMHVGNRREYMHPDWPRDTERDERSAQISWEQGSPVPWSAVDPKTQSFFKATLATAIIEYRKDVDA